MKFVFPVATRFLWWCHNISSLRHCTLNPSQNRTCAVNASGSRPSHVTGGSLWRVHRDQVSQLRRRRQGKTSHIGIELRPGL